MPEPLPRPTRLRFLTAPSAGLSSLSFMTYPFTVTSMR